MRIVRFAGRLLLFALLGVIWLVCVFPLDVRDAIADIWEATKDV